MKTDNSLLRFYNWSIKQIMTYSLAATVCVALLLSCTSASIITNAEPEDSDNDTSVSEDPAEETDSPPVEAVNDDNYDVPFDKNNQYSAIDYLDPFSNDMLYSAVIYDNSNGLPTSEANTISQTHEGFIWIGGYGGLVRYDGSFFEQISLEGIIGVKSLFTDSRNRLWVGATNNGFAMIEKGKTSYWYDIDGAEIGSVLAFTEDSDGIVYIATKNGLAFVDKDLSVKTVKDERVRNKYIVDIKVSSDGLAYGVDVDGSVFTVKDGVIQQFGRSGISQAVSLLPDPNNKGNVFVCSSDKLVYGSFDKTTPDGMKIHESIATLLPYIEYIQYVNGRIWFCARTGIYACEPDDHLKAYELNYIPMDNSICLIMQDYQGNYWFTSTRQGVMKIVPNPFIDIYLRDGFSEDVANSTCLYNGVLLVGTDNGVRIIYEEEEYSEFIDTLFESDFFEELSSVRVRSIIKDSKGNCWVSTYGKGLYCFDGKKLYNYTQENGLKSNRVRTVLEMGDGSFVVVENGGVDIIKDKKIVRSFGEEDGISNLSLLCAEEGLNGEIILGSDGDGIYIISKDGTVKNIGKKDGLVSGVIMRIKHDRTRDLFWLVTGDSIAYMTDDFKITNVSEFPYTNNYDLFQNSRDEMWILSSNGIYVAPTDKMIKNEAMTPVHYGINNGLTRIATSNSFNEFYENGDLFISGNTGVTKVNIETAFSKAPEIRASIQYIEADDKRVYPDEDGNFYLSSDVKKLTIHGFVFNYSLFTTNTSYCLEGFNSKYTNVGFNNNISVDYTNLSGGNYTFVIKALQSDGTESTTARVSIIKEKAIYEQPWFYVTIIIADILIVCIIIQIIMHFRIKKMKAKHKEEVEKERITTELETATNIQTGMLPSVFPPFPDRNEFDLFASMDPAKEVGGDFYDFFMIDDDHLGLVIADVSGKGVPAALVMMASKIMIADYAKMNNSPENILRAANDSICENNSEEMFVTAWVGILEISTGKLTAASAGHEYPAIKQPDGKFELFKDKRSMALGFMSGTRYHNYELQLKPGTKLFVYTDGVPEATDASEELFGTERMIEALNRDADASPEQLLKNVRTAVDEFVKDAEQFDDLTMLCVEYKKQSIDDLTDSDSD